MNPQDQRTKHIIGWLIVIVALIALATPRLRSQSTSSDPSAHFQKTFSITPGGALEVNNYKGTIHVTGSDTNHVAIDVNKHFEGNDADRKWWMENVQVNFRNESNRVAVEVKYPQWTWKFTFPGNSMCSWKVISLISRSRRFRATFGSKATRSRLRLIRPPARYGSIPTRKR